MRKVDRRKVVNKTEVLRLGSPRLEKTPGAPPLLSMTACNVFEPIRRLGMSEVRTAGAAASRLSLRFPLC